MLELGQFSFKGLGYKLLNALLNGGNGELDIKDATDARDGLKKLDVYQEKVEVRMATPQIVGRGWSKFRNVTGTGVCIIGQPSVPVFIDIGIYL